MCGGGGVVRDDSDEGYDGVEGERPHDRPQTQLTEESLKT